MSRDLQMSGDRQAWIDRARAVGIDQILRARNIKLVGRSPALAGPCPQCGGKDRFSVHLGKQVFNCRGCGARGGDAIDLVEFLDGCDFLSAVETIVGRGERGHGRHDRLKDEIAADKRDDRAEQFASEQERCTKAEAADVKKKAARAAGIWREHQPITEDCPAGRYLRGARGLMGAFPPTLGYLPAADRFPGAMVAAFGFCDEPEPGLIAPPAIVTGIQLTRLTPEGEKIAGDKPKIMLGPSAGLPIVLAPANDGLAIYITEGIEDGLHVREAYGTGVWVAGSAGRMPGIAAALPDYVECVRIFAHRDNPDDGGTGIRYAQEAASLIAATGVDVKIHPFG